MKTILLFGGRSEERMVSVASAQNLSRQFRFDELWFLHFGGAISVVPATELAAVERPFEIEFKPAAAPFAENILRALPKLSGSVVFMGLHGTEGEDGRIQSLFEKNEIPFTGSGSRSSADAFDKARAKEILRKLDLPVAEEKVLKSDQSDKWAATCQEFLQKFGKIVIKPVASGSSFGLHIISQATELEAALAEMKKASYGDYLLENFLSGRELTVGVFEEDDRVKPLPPSEVVLNAGHSFDYQGKYLGRGTTEITPAQLLDSEKKKAQDLAVAAHKALGCRGYTRTDMILTAKGPVFLETNTLPGMSKASFIPQQLQAANIGLEAFLQNQIKVAIQKSNS